MRKAVKRSVGAGLLAGLAFAIWRWWRARVPAPSGDMQFEPAPFPFPPVPRPMPARPASAPRASALDGSVEPNPDGTCPVSHPVKAKRASGIYHLPGGSNYARTKADRCYLDAAAAEADGLRPAKR